MSRNVLGKMSFLSWRTPLACLLFLASLYGGPAHAAKVTVVFAGLGAGGVANATADLNHTWDVASTDSTKFKNLGAGSTFTFQINLTAGAYVISSASATGGTVSGFQWINNLSHTSSSYHNTATFSYTVPATDSTISLNFAPRYTLTGSVTGSGALTLADGSAATGATYWAAGETATVRAQASSSDYGLEAFTFDGDPKSVTAYPSSQVFSGMPFPARNTTVSATFVRIYTLTPQIDTGGVTGAGTIDPAVPQRVKAGGSASFTVSAAAGSKILKIDIDGVTDVTSPNSPYTRSFTNIGKDWVIKAWFNTPAVNIKNYCNTPSFLSATIKPNLLLMLDNSASMYDLAYNSANSFCYDNSYQTDRQYYGYFESSGGEAYSYNFATNNFDPASATKPASCAYSTAYFCIQTSDGTTDGAVSAFWATGNFLNWLSASKIDQQKRILTGGKYEATSKVLIAESRGCLGRRFIKEIPASHWLTPTSGAAPAQRITFGVRGPNMFDPDNVSQNVQGGKSRIEIFKGSYNATACNAAVQDWSSADSIGDIQYGGSNNNTSACIGGDSTNLKSNAYNHVTHLCYRVQAGQSNGSAELTPLETDCVSIYGSMYGNNPANITNENGGDAVCAGSLLHPLMDGDTEGYLGRCWTGGTWVPYDPGDPSAVPPIPPTDAHWLNNVAPTWDDTCAAREVRHFCAGIRAADVTDPTDAALIARDSGTVTVVPSFIMDAGLNSLQLKKTMLVHVLRNAAPKGLIDEFSDVIGFGAMEFNKNGAGASAGAGSTSECSDSATSLVKCAKACKVTATGLFSVPFKECYRDADCASGTSCVEIPKTDGGRILSYIGDPVGDHATPNSLISRIDDIAATSWTPLAEAFYNAIGYYAHRDDLRLQTDDFDMAAARDPSIYTCRDNYVLLLSDGGSTVDQNSAVNALAAAYPGPSSQTGACSGGYQGSKSLDDLVYLANTRNIRAANFKSAPASAPAPVAKRERILTYAINTGKETAGSDECLSPSLLLKRAAANGGTGETEARLASDAETLANSMREVFSKVASRVTSGTAASILSNSEGSGANLLQAIFYPMKTFDSLHTKVAWIGELQNFWYYIDPFIGKSTVREDTAQDRVMNLKSDYVSQFTFNPLTAQTEVYLLQDSDGDGLGDTVPTHEARFITDMPAKVSADDVRSLWRAGRQLWLRNPADRKIYTQLNGTALANFTGAALGTDQETIQRLFQTSSEAEANAVINYVRGVDAPTYRDRGIAIPGLNSGDPSVWKLGDIISSTPRVQSSNKLNSYHLTPPAGYNDGSYAKFTSSTDYQNRGMAYVGANDGMLHAFKAGKLNVATSGDQKATLLAGTGGVLGKEEWAFIPKNAIPYLTYLTDPGYPHLYFVDGTATILDASINGCGAGTSYWDCPKDYVDGLNWRGVLIGGMGLGGASKNHTASDVPNSVKTPVTDLGYSSYFALDITNQTFDPITGVRDDAKIPSLLWEFAHEQLGYATSGPAIVRIAATTDGRPDNNKNGRWFAVFGSGPTGPIDNDACQFKGKSDQNMKLFVVDLKATGGWVLNSNYWIIDTGIPYAFVGSISSGVIDADRWNRHSPGYYSDDAVYAGYVRNTADDGSGTWTQGGVLRLLTKESMNPSDWRVAKVIDGIGPVTSNVSRLQDRKNHDLWLYFGSGRYFYNQDDMASGRKIFGVKEPCYTTSDSIRKDCSAADQVNSLFLTNQSGDTPSATLSVGQTKGWYINLAGETALLGAERSVTDPVALTNGAVFFTTYKPTGDPCQFGGKSRLWATAYDTGAAVPQAALRGKALVQISTGEFKEIDLATAFGDRTGGGGAGTGAGDTNGFRSMVDEMTGKPPSDPPPIVSTSSLKPVKKILHIQEH